MRYHLSMHCTRDLVPTLLAIKFQSTSSRRARPSSSFACSLAGEGTSSKDRVTALGEASSSSMSCDKVDKVFISLAIDKCTQSEVNDNLRHSCACELMMGAKYMARACHSFKPEHKKAKKRCCRRWHVPALWQGTLQQLLATSCSLQASIYPLHAHPSAFAAPYTCTHKCVS